MRITVIGTGYVGLVVGTGFAENGHRVVCVDRDENVIQQLESGKMPFYEPGLEELVMRNREEERLHFTTDLAGAVGDCLLVFLCVGTPELEPGVMDTSQVFDVADRVADALTGYRIIVNKSTCPVGTTEALRERIGQRTEHPFDVVANPEFLKEGAAVDDFMRPDRIVVGCEDVRVVEIMKELYAPFLRTGKPFLAMSSRSAEMAKFAVNAMLAVRISVTNELANIARASGANFSEVREALMADSRIGSTYLFPGLGFGGSCLPKDVAAVAHIGRDNGEFCPILEGACATNQHQLDSFVKRIVDHYRGDVAGKRIGVWGLSFKPRTDDIRNAPALGVIQALLNAGAEVIVYDPVAGDKAAAHFEDKVAVAPKMYACVDGVDGLVVATEWREFHHPDFDRMKQTMREAVVFDGRNLYSPKMMARMGFHYHSIGRPDV